MYGTAACTCPGEDHPGPRKSDGSFVGRSAPEIDILEAAIHDGRGEVSLSGQWAPYNAQYSIFNTSGEVEFDDPEITQYNSYVGGVYQQTTSGLAITNQNAYELNGGQFAVYAFEYKPGCVDLRSSVMLLSGTLNGVTDSTTLILHGSTMASGRGLSIPVL